MENSKPQNLKSFYLFGAIMTIVGVADSLVAWAESGRDEDMKFFDDLQAKRSFKLANSVW